ncbi:MAG: CPBP family intramembrane metalloprotease [Lachnospira sp.]|nr:CPBP family intramembrane metalloprotease [Lachnospira sp.]
MGKDLFKKPRMVAEAMKAQKGLSWILEILVFVAVFFVASAAQSMLMTPVQLILMATNADFMNATTPEQKQAILLEINNGDANRINMLICEIGMIAVACLFCKLFQKRSMSTLGFVKKGIFKEYLIGLVVGFAMFSMAVLIGVGAGAIELNGISPAFSLGLFVLYTIGFMIQGMAEEVLCRGYFMVSYARRYPVYAAILVNSLVFAALHLGNPGITVLSFVNLVLFGIFASVYFVRRGNLWGIGALHSIWNLVQGNFYGIKVSGLELTNSFLDTTMVEGNELFNGGDFGLEGSLSVTIVLVVGTIIMYFMKDKDKFEFDPALYQPPVKVTPQPMPPIINGQPMNGPVPPMYNQIPPMYGQPMNGSVPPMYNQMPPIINGQPMNGPVPPMYNQMPPMNNQVPKVQVGDMGDNDKVK